MVQLKERIENIWEPSPKQAEFAALNDDILEGFYAGAVYAGKTDILLLIPVLKRLIDNPRFKGLFLRRTFPELKNEVIPRSREYYRALGANYNKQDKVWEFPSGALIFFGHCEDEEDVHNYDSMQINYCAFDELTSFTEWQYLYLTLQRVRSIPNSGLPAIVRSASNPGNIGHNWVRKRFIDPYPEGMRIIENKFKSKRIFIPATIYDNPYVPEGYIRSLESLPEAEKQAKLYGNWSAYEGSVFDEFRDKSYPDEPSNAIHVVEPFDIPAYWPRIFSIDWGYAPPAMTYKIAGAISPDSRLYCYGERAFQKQKIAEWGPYVKEDLTRDNPRVIKLCKSGGQDRGQHHTVQGEIEAELGTTVELTNNAPGSRIAGKMLLHEYFRWKSRYIPSRPAAELDYARAEWLMRNRGLKEYQSYLDSFKPPKIESNLPKIQIFSDCKLLINAIKSCVYDKTHPQDVAEFPGDDPYDTVRYLVDEAERYFNLSIREHEHVQAVQQLEQNLAQTGDMHTFYMNARKLEQKQGSSLGALRRYSGRR
jgi:hypothetical protein